jgi:4-hydroxy-tetrahydrodipicolinate synthase
LQAYPTAIAGMKDSSGDWNNTKTFLDAFAETAPVARTFDVFVGSESFLLANMRNGGVGTISATANVNPVAIHELYADYNRQNCSGVCVKRRANRKALGTSASTTDLTILQARLNVVREVFARKSWPSMIAALKQTIAIYGNDPEWVRVRPPLVELTTEQARKLAAELEKIEFIINLVES